MEFNGYISRQKFAYYEVHYHYFTRKNLTILFFRTEVIPISIARTEIQNVYSCSRKVGGEGGQRGQRRKGLEADLQPPAFVATETRDLGLPSLHLEQKELNTTVWNKTKGTTQNLSKLHD